MEFYDGIYHGEWEGEPDIELFGTCSVFWGSEESLRQILDYLNTERMVRPVSEFDVYNKLGISGGRKDWGWTKDEGFHQFSVREMHPEGCPCCGKPW